MSISTTRREVFLGLGASAVLLGAPVLAQRRPMIEVLTDPGCDCCRDWFAVLRDAGFDLAVQEVDWDTLARFKSVSGVPEHLVSCHTGQVDGYLIEGHVPPQDLKRLLRERPTALGLSVPGMPEGSPGMGPESKREAYDVYLFGPVGQARLFARHPAL